MRDLFWRCNLFFEFFIYGFVCNKIIYCKIVIFEFIGDVVCRFGENFCKLSFNICNIIGLVLMRFIINSYWKVYGGWKLVIRYGWLEISWDFIIRLIMNGLNKNRNRNYICIVLKK